MIQIEEKGELAVVRMAHGKASALDLEFCRAILAAVVELEQSSTRAVVWTGTGGIFSAGVDLRRLVEEGAGYIPPFLGALTGAIEALLRFPKPLVAAVNGHAIAGGFILAAAADQRIASRGTFRLGTPELLVGVPFPVAALEAVRRVVRECHQADMILAGTLVSPDVALERGLVDALVAPAALLTEAEARASQLAAIPPVSFSLTKRQLRAPLLDRIAAARARFDPEIERAWLDPGVLSAIRDYVARTLGRS